jgi:hypothetical protein
VDGEKSEQEQHGLSKRTLGGKAARVRAGEWQGGPVRLGFDVACYDRKTDRELWRVVAEGLHKRLKVYPDGRTERFDGKGNFPAWQREGRPSPEYLRLTPNRDKAKVAAAVGVFKQYAAEAVSFTELAHRLNTLGFRTAYGGRFQSHHVQSMLEDPIFLGYYTYNRRHFGKFNRWAGGGTVPDLNYEERQSKNDKADWVQSDRRLFPPLVDRPTWDAVQKKLAGRVSRTNSPRTGEQYLSGLLVCGGCGRRMVAGCPTAKDPRKGGHAGGRHYYFCGGYQKAAREGRRKEHCEAGGCRRNGVYQDELEPFIDRWLQETGRKLEALTGGPADPATGRLERQEEDAYGKYWEAIRRLAAYLAEHHPEEYGAIMEEERRRRDEEEADVIRSGLAGRTPCPPGTLRRMYGKQYDDAVRKAAAGPVRTYGPGDEEGFVSAALALYRANFDPAVVDAEIARLEAEHDDLMRQWGTLPTPRAREKAQEQFAKLEARIDELKAQRQDQSQAIADALREMHDLQDAIHAARRAMKDKGGDSALRRKAEALRAVIHRIECGFTATDVREGVRGRHQSRLASVTVYPVVGETAEFQAENAGEGANPGEQYGSRAPRRLMVVAYSPRCLGSPLGSSK